MRAAISHARRMKVPRARILLLSVGTINAGLVPAQNLIRESSDSLAGSGLGRVVSRRVDDALTRLNQFDRSTAPPASLRGGMWAAAKSAATVSSAIQRERT